jgi:hypothetical protein
MKSASAKIISNSNDDSFALKSTSLKLGGGSKARNEDGGKQSKTLLNNLSKTSMNRNEENPGNKSEGINHKVLNLGKTDLSKLNNPPKLRKSSSSRSKEEGLTGNIEVNCITFIPKSLAKRYQDNQRVLAKI